MDNFGQEMEFVVAQHLALIDGRNMAQNMDLLKQKIKGMIVKW